ncbi:MAG: hypothetical protein P8L77_06150, partial [Gammaproteobacteria bacterium]|nr:hypothetical protein [Gammaproteobacteria bacterium]
QDLHPRPSKHIYPQRQVYRKRLNKPSSSNTLQASSNTLQASSNTLQALPMFKPSPIRQRRPSFIFDTSSNDFK